MSDKTRIQTELDLLSALERGEVVTQMALSRRLSVSVGLVNALLKRVTHKGLVKARAAPYKRWAYYVTPRGFAEKGRLVAEYLEASLDFFRQARTEYVDSFVRARACGVDRIVLVGRGELADIALIAAREADIDVVGLFDETANVDHPHGLPILRTFDGLDAETALAITASRRPQEAYERAAALADGRLILAPALLRIAREPPAEAET